MTAEENLKSSSTDVEALHDEIGRLKDEIRRLKGENAENLVYKHQLDAILDNAHIEINLKDCEGRYLRVNKEFERRFGVRNDEIVGLMPSYVHTPELAAATRQYDLGVLASGVPERREELFGGEQHTLIIIKFPVFDDDRNVIGLGSIVADITKSKRMEETLRRTQRMDAIGQFTGGICHDFNNILGIVMGNLELLAPYVKTNRDALNYCESAYKAASRGAELTGKLLSFSRTTTGRIKSVSLNTFINDVEGLFLESLMKSIVVKKRLASELWNVKIDHGDLEDSILNLLLNARDAMLDGGEIIISTSNVELDEQFVRSHPGAQPGQYVMLSIKDNGHGMNVEVLKRSTEPFFTLKGSKEGTGLGLSMVYGFVHRSGGYLDILSEPDQGTDVRIYFPRTNEDPETPVADFKSPSAFEYGHETILIVDDEVSLVDIAASHLHDLGYETIRAYNSQEALAVIHSGKLIDLLVADVIMPGDMDGFELAVAAQLAQPSLKVLLTSGFNRKYTDNPDVENERTSALLENLLRKPYSVSCLSMAVRNALNS